MSFVLARSTWVRDAGPQARLGFSLLWRVQRRKMTRTELIIQLLKVVIGLAFRRLLRLVEFTSARPINP